MKRGHKKEKESKKATAKKDSNTKDAIKKESKKSRVKGSKKTSTVKGSSPKAPTPTPTPTPPVVPPPTPSRPPASPAKSVTALPATPHKSDDDMPNADAPTPNQNQTQRHPTEYTGNYYRYKKGRQPLNLPQAGQARTDKHADKQLQLDKQTEPKKPNKALPLPKKS